MKFSIKILSYFQRAESPSINCYSWGDSASAWDPHAADGNRSVILMSFYGMSCPCEHLMSSWNLYSGMPICFIRLRHSQALNSPIEPHSLFRLLLRREPQKSFRSAGKLSWFLLFWKIAINVKISILTYLLA